MPIDPERFELRDPHTRFVAYVPPGALAAGMRLAASGGPAGLPCATCHGDGLRGGIAPPLAGRSPTTLMRQLAAFKAGARANAEAAPMRAITASLDDRQMIALAAYAATLKP
jgi:cytochrome c553